MFSRRIFKKHSNIKFYKNQSSGIGFVSCGRADVQTDMMKVMDAFRSIAKAPKNVRMTKHLAPLGPVSYWLYWLRLLGSLTDSCYAKLKTSEKF